ncbi:MAG: 3'-5' exonuclease, partial [Verrucomicrobiota bacterium]
ARLFAAGRATDPARGEFIEAFKRATFGTEEKRLLGRLDDFLDGHAETWLDAPRAECWGDARRIWPGGNAWLAAAAQRAAAAETLRAALPWAALGDGPRARLEAFFAALPEWSPGAPLPKPVGYLVGNAFKVWAALGAGHAEVTLERKKIALGPEACAALVAVVEGIGGAELARQLEMTRGIADVLRGYDAAYHDTVRRAGRLTFADVTRLLRPVALACDGAREGGGERRLLVDWRLDAQFDHWLLDEFQDTSFAQWSVLKNLVDEAVQDAEGRRSFFYVGDVKQAIFAWREGDARLFREIFDHYNAAAPGAIAEERLTESWRSGPAVIAMVNRVFGDDAALRALVPADAARRWSDEWRAHESARPELGGWAELRHAQDEDGRFAETLAILRETEPVRRGLTVAVLVQKNDTAARLADYLRREGGLAAVAESDLRVATDNPLSCALLALLRAAAHPGDTLAHGHLRMTPLGAVLAAAGLVTPDALTAWVLGELHAGGFAGTLEKWLRALEPALAPEDAFSRLRGAQLVELAREFDEGGRRDVAEFLAQAEAHTVRDTDAAGTVRVMTVHKAKGLGFDLVILPDLEGQRLAQRRKGLAVHRNAAREVEWVLDLPSTLLAEGDGVLAAHVAGEEADAAYEALCVLYVAMTRAKRAMFIITGPPKAMSRSHNFPKLLQETLGETWSAGDPAWFASLERGEGLGSPVPATGGRRDGLEPLAGAPGLVRLVARRPSGEQPTTRDGAALFAPESGAGMEFGSAVHALLSEVEWGGAEVAAKLATIWRERGGPAAVADTALACLRATALAGVWTKPDTRAEVWRERAFEAVLDGAWVTGVFDRVVITRDTADQVTGATVFDFKTDAVPDAARHAGQMGLYRGAAALLLGLPETAVRAELVFTATQERAEIAR